MNLFKAGMFKLHSGSTTDFKIDCDALTDEDLEAVAQVLARMLPPFGRVEGVPRGGLRLAEAMSHWAGGPPDRLVIVDDVLTTGKSMEKQKRGREAYGAVIFARGPCPPWVLPLFTMRSPLLVATEAQLRRTVRQTFDDEPLPFETSVG